MNAYRMKLMKRELGCRHRDFDEAVRKLTESVAACALPMTGQSVVCVL